MTPPQSLVARPVSKEHHLLGEGPLWDAERERLLWLDIDAGLVLEGAWRDGTVEVHRRHAFDGKSSAVVSGADGQLLVAVNKSVLSLSPDGERQSEVPLIPAGKNSRLNDGACDPAGRFLVGSMALDDRTGEDALYRLESDGTVTTLDPDVTLSNGLGWSPDSSEMYSVDTTPGIVWARSYRVADGAVGERRALLHITDGSPDGLCVGVDGSLWIAVWGQGQVRRYTPDGEHLATVYVDAPHTSCPAFVGADLRTLLITTASSELSGEQRAAFPDSGRLFAVDVDIAGLPPTPWSGSLRTT